MPFTVFVLTDERYLDPAPDAVSVSPGEGPPATLVCEYRSEIDGAVLSRSSQYDSLILPPPSCPYEIQVPAP